MEIGIRKEKNATVVSITGRLDAVTSPEFEERLSELISRGDKDIIIDLGGLDYVSSAGLRIILATAKDSKEKGGQLLLSALQDMVKEVFEISGFTSIIPIYDSVASALAEIQ